VLDAWVTNVENEMVPAAAALNGDKFAFAPGGGAFQGVRTFGGQIKHLAAANYQIGAKVLGEKSPHGEHDEEAPDTVRTKSEILDYLKGSFAYLHRAMATITEDTLVQPIPGAKGVWQRTRLGLAVDAVAHSYDQEESQRCRTMADRANTKLPFVQQVHLIGANLFRPKLIRRTAEVFCERLYNFQVAVHGSLRVIATLESSICLRSWVTGTSL
jgi:hypothetical protein